MVLASGALACAGQVGTSQATGGSGDSNAPVGGSDHAAGAADGNLGGSGGSGTSQSTPNNAGTDPVGDVCVTDGGLAAYQSPASGSFSGSDLDGVICTGGAFAYLERTQASSYVGSQLLVIIGSSWSGNPANNLQFKNPANATGAMLTIMAGVSSASPGTYVSSLGQSCGGLAFCVYLPLPASVQCPDDAGACAAPYCAMQGPIMGPTCEPVTPEVCYVAQAASSCLPGSQTPLGSWTLTLTSVEPYSSDAGSAGMSYYVVHGSLTAAMVEDPSAPDAGLATASLTIGF
jgi:hypothetical protein